MANKKPDLKEPVYIKPEGRPDTSRGFGRILLGLIFITVGFLALADNLGWVDVVWENLWYFWPIVIIAIGLSIISIGGLFWKVLTTILGLSALLAVVWFMTLGAPNVAQPVAIDTMVQKIDKDVRQLDVNIKTGASSIAVDSFDSDLATKVVFKSNLLKLKNESLLSDGIQRINLETISKSENAWIIGDVKNSWSVYLSDNLPVDISIDAGASKLDLDLESIKLRQLDIKAGASSIDILLGSLEKDINLDIDAGVSSVVIKIPKDSGIEINIEGGLNSKGMLDLEKISDSLYRSADYGKAENNINITSEIGVSSFTLERY